MFILDISPNRIYIVKSRKRLMYDINGSVCINKKHIDKMIN